MTSFFIIKVILISEILKSFSVTEFNRFSKKQDKNGLFSVSFSEDLYVLGSSSSPAGPDS